MFQGTIGDKYSREDIQKLLGVPVDRQGGNWDTGYTEWDGQFFVFCNIRVAGRTGHDYDNHWDGSVLAWQAKGGTEIAQAQMQRLLGGDNPVHVFHRSQDRTPFTYAGLGRAIEYDDVSPVRVRWSFGLAPQIGEGVLETDLDVSSFEREFSAFEGAVLSHSGHRFQSITTGLPGRWENYKTSLRERAIELLSPETWLSEDIGSGRILDAVIHAIEIPGAEGNNFVRWHGQWGPDTQQHKLILDARKNSSLRRKAEDLFFSLYTGKADDSDCFSELIEQFGKNYSLPAYLFFVKDPEIYMPIAPVTFDKALVRIGSRLRTSYNCSWDNYAAYNRTLQNVRGLLAKKAGFENCRLVDAHSFLWLLIRIEEEAARKRSSRSNNKEVIYGPRERSVFEMARNALQAAAQSGKQTTRTYKNKEVQESELREVIDDLISEQKGLCNITGIKLQFVGDSDDNEILASLDRIDSDGHYERQNLQVVCRFVNRWKSSSGDADFRRLVGLVRSMEQEE
ncbi:DUF3427 domain-containing protein [Rhizobium ruizarguesonis]